MASQLTSLCRLLALLLLGTAVALAVVTPPRGAVSAPALAALDGADLVSQSYSSASTSPLGALDTVDSTIAISGTVALVGSSTQPPYDSLGLIDVSDPARLARRALLPLRVQQIELAGSRAYVATTDDGLKIFDISAPASPALLGAVGAPATIRDLQVVGSTVYMIASVYNQQQGAYSTTLQVVNAADPTAPAVIASLPLQPDSAQLEVSGTRLYVDLLYIAQTGAGPGFGIIDVSAPAAPVALRAYGFSFKHFDVSGALVYGTSGTSLTIVDTSALDSPAVRSTTDLGMTEVRVQVAGDRAYLMGNVVNSLQGRLVILSVSNPAAPAPLGSLLVPWQYCTSYVAGGRLYALCGGLHIYDISVPSAPALLGDYLVPADVRRVQVIGAYAFVLDRQQAAVSGEEPASCPRGGTTLWAVDVSVPALPVRVSMTDVGSCAELIGAAADELVFAEGSTVTALDVSDPAAPVVSTTLTMPVAGQAAQLVGQLAYVVDGSKLTIVETDAPSGPLARGSYNFAGTSIVALQVVAGHAYVLTGAGLSILDVSNPNQPLLENTAPLALPFAVHSVQIAGGRAYITGVRSQGLTGYQLQVAIADVTAPQAPALLGVYASDDRVWFVPYGARSSVVIRDNLLLLISGSATPASWDILDVTSGGRPVRVGRYAASGEPHDAQLVGDLLYLGSDSGLQLLTVNAAACRCSELFLPTVRRE